MLAPGQSFPVTQSAINIEDLLGKFIFSMGDTGKSNSQGGNAQGQPASPSSSGGISNPASLPSPAASSGANK
jgi:phospholipid/cholesterol/gamma-HCH transport system substrate-binding protein